MTSADQSSDASSQLTSIGYLLIAFAAIATAALALLLGPFYMQYLPAGICPALVLAIPAILVGIVIFGVGAVVLNAIGLPAVIKLCPRCQKPKRIGDCGHEFHQR